MIDQIKQRVLNRPCLELLVRLVNEELDGYVPFEAIPLVLFNWVLKGGAKPAGVTISAASDGIITYKIAKFKEEVTII